MIPMLLDTIRFTDGTPELLSLHEQRIAESLREYGITTPGWSLHEVLTTNPCPAKLNGTVKCRVLYDTKVQKVQYIPYQKRPIDSLQCVKVENIDYHLKWENREVLNTLSMLKGSADEILIIDKDGHITDTSYTNVALLQNDRWYTPGLPLLRGVRREHLLHQGIITPRDIPADTLGEYRRIALFNAMIPWEERIELLPTQIYL